MPVYKEPTEELKSLSEWMEDNHQPGIEWIVVSASDDDKPLRVPEEAVEVEATECNAVVAAAKARIKVLQASTGRSLQMNSGAGCAEGKILLFLHADTRLGAGWQQALRLAAQSERVAWGAFAPCIDAQGALFRLAESWGRWRSQALALPYGDQALFIKRDLFLKVGCYDEIVQFMEEVDLSRRLVSLGLKPRILAVEARTSARKWSVYGSWQSVRNIVAIMLYLSGVPRECIECWYKGRVRP